MLAVEQPPQHAVPPGNLEGIFREHHSRVFAAAFRVTGSAQDAEDVLQTVFLRLLKRSDLDLSPSPGSYLHRAAINAAVDLLRARSRSGSIPMDDFDALPSDRGEESPARRQDDREVRQGLREAMLGLSAKNAEIFALRFFEGLPNREIANTFGMTQTAVGVALHRARNQVKKELTRFLGGASHG